MAADTMMDRAITDSMNRSGRLTQPKTEQIKVMECAKVNAVITFRVNFAAVSGCRAALGVAAGPVHTVPEALEQPHTAARDMFIQRNDYQGVGLPIKLSKTPGSAGVRPPRLGEHNSDIIR